MILASCFSIAALLLLAADSGAQQRATDVILEQAPFRFYSAFWPNLHNLLWAEAWARRPPSASSPAGRLPEPLTGPLTADERADWDAAVAYYDRELADRHPLFELGEIRKLLLAAGDDLPAAGLAPQHRDVLTRAAAVYRKYWWNAHDRANRAWTADAAAKIAALSPAVPERLAQKYETPWFTDTVRIDVVRVGGREGAFTAREPLPIHVTISSGNPIITDWMAAEILFHESSHGLAVPLLSAFAAEGKAQGKNPRDFWHPSLFFLTGEIVRQALAARGVAYEPYMYKTRMFERAWPDFRAPIETAWKAFVNDEMPRDEAIRNMIAALK